MAKQERYIPYWIHILYVTIITLCLLTVWICLRTNLDSNIMIEYGKANYTKEWLVIVPRLGEPYKLDLEQIREVKK